MLIQGKILSGNTDLSEAFAIRRKVFVEELLIPEEKEFDDLDPIAMHVIVYEEDDNKKAVATGRIYFDGTNCEIGHIAVLKEYRRKEYGDFTLRMLLNKAFTAGIKSVYSIVPKDCIEFFQSVGFIRNEEEILDNDKIFYRMTITDKDTITDCKKMKKCM
jgi:N-acetylglutamate synthase-like GNAT family acetyltransferase